MTSYFERSLTFMNVHVYLSFIIVHSDELTYNQLKDSLNSWVNKLVSEFHPNEKLTLTSFGFIHSPNNSSRNQPWHIDYGPHFSNLFVPMCEIEHEQFNLILNLIILWTNQMNWEDESHLWFWKCIRALFIEVEKINIFQGSK